MKYFEFEHRAFEYAALIAARNVEDAINCYNDNIDDLTEYNFDAEPLQPKEITEVEAFGMVNSVCSIDEVEETINAVEALENNNLDIDYEAVLMLIDADLM